MNIDTKTANDVQKEEVPTARKKYRIRNERSIASLRRLQGETRIHSQDTPEGTK